ncbi:hypothetical protein L5515_011891 [Caenorhabditis briggsae]|uniref:DNA mismatch repair proteins mutS family domain-containing protein n=1 Tax=Caenorhabditis briggsae TaxID=6238 RepID=A0AAE9EVJ8_CAEBR|nr:hypothetical protein L5515_011891 [Caenorhabditis briggsae]
MATRWRYYNSKRGNNNRGRGRGRNRGTSLTAISLPRQDRFPGGLNDDEFFQDKPMNAKEFVDETVLSVSFSGNMLGAACYEQSSQLVRIMNDVSEDHEFALLGRLIEEVKPTMIIANRSQDLDFIKLLSSKYAKHERLPSDGKSSSHTSTYDTIPTWDASLVYSSDDVEEKEDQDDDDFDGPPATLHKLPNNFFKMPNALQRLKMMVGSDDAKMTDEDKHIIVAMRFDIEAVNMMRSFGALLLFLDETRLGVENQPLSVSSPIKSIKTMTLENLVDIDYSTIQALDILPKEIESKDWNAEITAKIASMLGKVTALNNVFQRFQSGTAKLLHWECFVSTVNALVDVVHILRQTPIAKEFPVENSLLTEVSEIAIIASSIINFAESRIQGRVTVNPAIDEELDKLRDIYENMPLFLTAVAKQECARLGLDAFSNVTIVYIPLVGFVLSLPTNFPVENYSDMSLVYAKSDEVRVRNETTERLDDEYGDILMKLIDSQTAIILALKTRVLKKKRSISKLLSVAARIDALISMGLVAAENGWNCPTLMDEPVIEALELFHPISVLVVKKNFVPNKVTSGRDGIKASIITGPNACGKSVYMKSIGILAFLTHIGSFVPARYAKVGIVDRIVTRMFTVDSVLDGMSTFAKDVEQVAFALRKATGNSLVIIDEFGKGTMTEVGLALLASCMTYWMNKGPEHCPHIFLASHFHALPKHIPLDKNIASFLTFKVLREGEGKIKYLFQLAPGLIDCSFAMAVAKEEGIPMPVIGRACRIYKALKSGVSLKEIKAEVSKNNDEKLVAEMDIVLRNEDGFIDAVESFVIRQQREEIEAKARSEAKASYTEPSEVASLQDNLSSVSKRKSENYQRTRGQSVLSTKSAQSVDSVLDALLPKRKRIATPILNESNVTQEPPRSPDPFSIDDDSVTSKGEEREDVISTTMVPQMQRLASEEEEDHTTRSHSSVMANPQLADKYNTPAKPGGTKGCQPSSTSKFPISTKIPKTTDQTVLLNDDFNVPETPNQPNQTSRLSSRSFLMPQLPYPDKYVLDRIKERSTKDSMFKTPTNDRRLQKLTQGTPRDRDIHTPIQSSRNTPEAHNSMFKTPNATKSGHNMMTPRTSSRREFRKDDILETPQTPKNRSSFTPSGSPFSIFASQATFGGISSSETSDHDMSQFFGSLNNNRVEKAQSKNSQSTVFDTPVAKSSEKQRYPSQKSSSKSRVSPSSVVLERLTGEESQKTPQPRGDNIIDFEFQINDTDPIYGKKDHLHGPSFDFLNSQDDADDNFMDFLDSPSSSRIDTGKKNRNLKLSNACIVPYWNQVTTDDVTHSDEFKKWRATGFGDTNNLIDAESRLLSAFVYPEEISIITTALYTFGKPATCRYYDCNRIEIHSARFKSVVWPLSVITCPRRLGIEYVSVSFEDEEEEDNQVIREPIPLVFRAYEKPIHEISVCVGPLYGNESKWLETIEYVEHYRLLGATFFYFNLFNMNDYDRKIIDDYERLGLAESTKYVTEYLRLGWMSHLLQTHECHHRSKFHSKWVINMDIDERLVYTGPFNLKHYLKSMPPNIGEISFSTNRVLKTEKIPEKYTSEAKLLSDMMFIKYNKTTEISWYNLKGVIRPELVASLFFHWSFFQFEGVKVMSVPKRFGHVRHYRNVDGSALNGNWMDFYNGTLRETRLASSFEKKLAKAVRKRVKYVYDQRMIRCEEIPNWVTVRYRRELLDCKFKYE